MIQEEDGVHDPINEPCGNPTTNRTDNFFVAHLHYLKMNRNLINSELRQYRIPYFSIRIKRVRGHHAELPAIERVNSFYSKVFLSDDSLGSQRSL